ncbi:uncharacterized protein BKA55DRAFT_673481 [Fusarium redolens]|uniref:Uncharacterized protein n=1 Tax=Fusarium redolens TaxID=48865 RepID=A0A9P9HL61_FUSRE|nr:uncharacterized protein BKA55DRAFT_673481 [Fusarium redolens]KAH7259112.1 hypothetical protein BKA55DRAFT_673481 [Fusarium redolens]
MSTKASEKTDMVVEKPSKESEEMLAKESVKKPNMTVQGTTAPGVQAHEEAIPEVNEVRYAYRYGDGSGLPLRPGMGPPMTEEQFQELWEKKKALGDWIRSMSLEEFYARFPMYNDPKDYSWTEEEAHAMLQEDEDPELKARDERYARLYGDGSDLPLQPGMGPPETEEESEESWKKAQAEADETFDMPDEEFHAKFPEYKDLKKDYFCTEEEAWMILEGDDEDKDRNHVDEKE